ncbi:ferrochelatase [Martelella alba]|uniref:Ferrochelatase n=1 Tax=Martelella alba TaxID=2590451 RepID=A0ABY2SLX5_9HYPH|nr:ferrochelatase [Martelella alba]TKI06251.1 ferrochelatase [Martelella alba]
MDQEKKGVLLVNLGTPDAATPAAVKRFLAEFLSDRRVVDTPRWLWRPILYGIILPFRSPRVAKLYRSIWMTGGSPLLVYSKRQQAALAARLPDAVVELAMSYGRPELPGALRRLLAAGISELVVLPLYPQYSSSTSASIWDAVARVLAGCRKLPSVRFIRDYADHPAYITALRDSISDSFAKHGRPDRLILSFHGIPQRYARDGDDYPQRCEDTRRLLVAALDFPPERIMLTFQSRFGREPWLTPYTDQTLGGLPAQGVRHVQILCPGFSSDCLETLEEINVQNREIFLHAGGEKYHYIPALNDSPAQIALFCQLIGGSGPCFGQRSEG